MLYCIRLGETHDIMSYTYTAEEFAGGTKIRFKNALIAGLATEFFSICGSALNFIQFVMIRRLKEYVITNNQNKKDSPLVF
ncbi:hypothetical protein CRE_08910 [Caenorhabditis remanei]|uniref:Uncharacterized protein n=1 Tax=Caenorhabditis remanei TaxID=31234 RepID=E3LI90_CAERE|nr:hypothetical protein CRE_08910 [Caenorhabditis remanei]